MLCCTTLHRPCMAGSYCTSNVHPSDAKMHNAVKTIVDVHPLQHSRVHENEVQSKQFKRLLTAKAKPLVIIQQAQGKHRACGATRIESCNSSYQGKLCFKLSQLPPRFVTVMRP